MKRLLDSIVAAIAMLASVWARGQPSSLRPNSETKSTFNVVVGGIGESSLNMAAQFGVLAEPGIVYRIRFHDANVETPAAGLLARIESTQESLTGSQTCVRTLDVKNANDPRIRSFVTEATSKPQATLAIELDYGAPAKFVGANPDAINEQSRAAAKIAVAAAEEHAAKHVGQSTDTLFVHGEAAEVLSQIGDSESQSGRAVFQREVAASPQTWDLPKSAVILLTEHDYQMGLRGCLMTKEKEMLGEKSPARDVQEWVDRGNAVLVRTVRSADNPEAFVAGEARELRRTVDGKLAEFAVEAKGDAGPLARAIAIVAGKHLGDHGEHSLSASDAAVELGKEAAKELTQAAAKSVGLEIEAGAGLAGIGQIVAAHEQIRTAEAAAAELDVRAARVTAWLPPSPQSNWKPGEPPPSPTLREHTPVILENASLGQAARIFVEQTLRNQSLNHDPSLQSVGGQVGKVDAPSQAPLRQSLQSSLQRSLPHKGGGIALTATALVPLYPGQIQRISWDAKGSRLVVWETNGERWQLPSMSPYVMQDAWRVEKIGVDPEFSIGCLLKAARPGTADLTQLGTEATYFSDGTFGSLLGLVNYRADLVIGAFAFGGSSVLASNHVSNLAGFHTLAEICPVKYTDNPAADLWGGGSRIVLESRPSKLLPIGNRLVFNDAVVELVPRFGRTTEPEAAFSAMWCQDYHALIANVPEFADLLECARAIGLVKWALQTGAPLDFDSLPADEAFILTPVQASAFVPPTLDDWAPKAPFVMFGPDGPDTLVSPNGAIVRATYVGEKLSRVVKGNSESLAVYRDELGAPVALSTPDGAIAFVTSQAGSVSIAGPVSIQPSGGVVERARFNQSTTAHHITDSWEFINSVVRTYLYEW